jgi:prepilin-type N-terminal cleavage/methylation domain-containing protein
MKTARMKNGFTILEVLMSMVILAMLMTAVAVAFDASIVNFQANESLSKTTNAGRAALLRMTTELRTAQIVGVIGVEDPDNTQCFLRNAAGNDIRYWLDTGTTDEYGNHPLRLNMAGTLDHLDLNFEKNNPILCKNVRRATFERAYTTIGGVTAVRNVRIVLTLTDDKGNNAQNFAAATVVRRNLD